MACIFWGGSGLCRSLGRMGIFGRLTPGSLKCIWIGLEMGRLAVCRAGMALGDHMVLAG